MSELIDTRYHILQVAYELMQERGYNAFSYADIAEQVGVRKASIHYYFPNKSDLARSVVEHYRAAARAAQVRIKQEESDPVRQLERFAEFVGYNQAGELHMCVCGLLAAELPTLPADVRAEVQGFYHDGEAWITDVLHDGIARGVIRLYGPVPETAQLLMASVEGAMISARAYNDPQRYRVLIRCLTAAYCTAA